MTKHMMTSLMTIALLLSSATVAEAHYRKNPCPPQEKVQTFISDGLANKKITTRVAPSNQQQRRFKFEKPYNVIITKQTNPNRRLFLKLTTNLSTKEASDQTLMSLTETAAKTLRGGGQNFGDRGRGAVPNIHCVYWGEINTAKYKNDWIKVSLKNTPQ